MSTHENVYRSDNSLAMTSSAVTDMVAFLNVPEAHSVRETLMVRFEVSEMYEAEPNDMVCVLPLGWSDPQEALVTTILSETEPGSLTLSVYQFGRQNKLLLSADELALSLRRSTTNLFQLCYFTPAGILRGASSPFKLVGLDSEASDGKWVTDPETDCEVLVPADRVAAIRLGEMSKENALLQERYQGAMKTLQNLQITHESRLASLQEEREELRLLVLRLEREVAETRVMAEANVLAAVERTNARDQCAIDDLVAQNAELRTLADQLPRAKVLYAEKDAEYKTMCDQVGWYQEDVEKLEQDKSSLTVQRDDMQRRINELTVAHEAMAEGQLKEAKREVAAVREEMIKQQRSHGAELARRHAEVLMVRKQLEDARADLVAERNVAMLVAPQPVKPGPHFRPMGQVPAHTQTEREQEELKRTLEESAAAFERHQQTKYTEQLQHKIDTLEAEACTARTSCNLAQAQLRDVQAGRDLQKEALRQTVADLQTRLDEALKGTERAAERVRNLSGQLEERCNEIYTLKDSIKIEKNLREDLSCRLDSERAEKLLAQSEARRVVLPEPCAKCASTEAELLDAHQRLEWNIEAKRVCSEERDSQRQEIINLKDRLLQAKMEYRKVWEQLQGLQIAAPAVADPQPSAPAADVTEFDPLVAAVEPLVPTAVVCSTPRAEADLNTTGASAVGPAEGAEEFAWPTAVDVIVCPVCSLDIDNLDFSGRETHVSTHFAN